MEILKQFGVDWFLLTAQIVNFLILLYLLNKFLYKPLLKVLDVRKQKIAESLKHAEEIEERLERISKEREKSLQETAAEVKSMIDDANKTVAGIVAEGHEKAGKDVKKLLERAETTMKLEQDKLHQEIREELASLVIAGLQKVSGKVFTQKDQKELIQQSLKELK